ncbi:MAG: hypothetical protein IPM29_09050 [Planctomycetes bacterium]|nr:hypothetical protein [Planctomycetota bacterium]
MSAPTELAKRRAPRPLIADWWKIIAMGVVLAGLIHVAFFYETSPAQPLGSGPPVAPMQVEVPIVDRDLLATVRDATRAERLDVEAAPLAHLLELSVRVVPTIAVALGMPEEPIPLSVLRADPSVYRGAYLAYEGKLGHLAPGAPGHPIEGYQIHKGWIDLEDGEKVLFQVSLPPKDIAVGDWCRIEGFFLKLLDSNHFPTANQAPLLIGPELFSRFEPWAPVAELDPAAFASMRDGIVENGWFVDMQDAERGLAESEQDETLWLLASYVAHRHGGPDDTREKWASVAPFVTKEQLDRTKYGQVQAGTPFRLLGRFIRAEWSVASPNPIGVTHWTQAWVQIRELGSKVVPVWIPKKIDAFTYNEGLEVRAYYYRRLVYPSRNDATVFTPVFVAADLDRYQPWPEHPTTTWVKYGFVVAVLGVIALFFVSALRDRRARDQFELDRLERQRRRRTKGAEQPAQPVS